MTRDDITPALSGLWQPLPGGESEGLADVQVLRLDAHHSRAPGNKWFKLQPLLEGAREEGCHRLLSFGGAWSNHLHALAALGAAEGFATIGVVRGDIATEPTPTLRDCLDLGMHLVPVSRGDYRRRHDPAFQAQLLAAHGPALLVPEGGDCPDGARGCLPLGREIARAFPGGATVVLPVGTGTTLAGIVAALGSGYRVLGMAALKGAGDLEQRVARNLEALLAGGHADGAAGGCAWEIRHDCHEGGFARVSPALRQFLCRVETQLALPLEPVYTAKALFALQRLLAAGEIDRRRPVVFVHTGGLQGRRGYDWLPPYDSAG